MFMNVRRLQHLARALHTRPPHGGRTMSAGADAASRASADAERTASVPVLDQTRNPFRDGFIPGHGAHSELLRQLNRNATANGIKLGPSNAFHNHAAALMTAMWRLGATESELAQALDTTPELSGLKAAPAPSESGVVITQDNWESKLGGVGLYGLGADKTFPGYRAFFEAEIARVGPEEMLATYLPRLARGAVGDFFHAVIELGYHFESRSPELLSVGMGWLAASYVEIPGLALEGRPAFTSAVAALEGLSKDPHVFPTFDLNDGSSGYIAAIEDLSAAAEHQAAVLKYDLGDVVPAEGETADHAIQARLRDICSAAADSFAAGGCVDFYTLHSITGSRAVWAILNGAQIDLAGANDLIRVLWRGILYTHVSRNRPWPPPPVLTDASSPGRPWVDICTAGRTSQNSHVTKVLMTCADFWDQWQDPRFWVTAEGVVAARDAGGKLVGTGVGSKIGRFDPNA